MIYIECSAKSGQNVSKIFETIADEIYAMLKVSVDKPISSTNSRTIDAVASRFPARPNDVSYKLTKTYKSGT